MRDSDFFLCLPFVSALDLLCAGPNERRKPTENRPTEENIDSKDCYSIGGFSNFSDNRGQKIKNRQNHGDERREIIKLVHCSLLSVFLSPACGRGGNGLLNPVLPYG
jgi:hypothetical protein